MRAKPCNLLRGLATLRFRMNSCCSTLRGFTRRGQQTREAVTPEATGSSPVHPAIHEAGIVPKSGGVPASRFGADAADAKGIPRVERTRAKPCEGLGTSPSPPAPSVAPYETRSWPADPTAPGGRAERRTFSYRHPPRLHPPADRRGPPRAARRRAPADLRVPWAELLKKVFALDVLACPECGSRLQIIAFIAQPKVAHRILDHLGFDSAGPPLARAQAKPEVFDPGPDYAVPDPTCS